MKIPLNWDFLNLFWFKDIFPFNSTFYNWVVLAKLLFTIERAMKHDFFQSKWVWDPPLQYHRGGLRGFRQCPAIPRWFPEAPRSRRVALGQQDPWKSLLCFSLQLDRRGSCQAQLCGNTGLGQFKKSYLDLTMGCQTPVLCGILSVKAIPLGPWDAYVISISIKKWLTKPHNVSHLEGE